MTAKVINGWSLLEFVKSHGSKLRLAPFTDPNGEAFHSLVVGDGTSKVLVGFSSNLGELSSAEIIARKDNLRIVQLESGSYKLCEGTDTWETIDLGL